MPYPNWGAGSMNCDDTYSGIPYGVRYCPAHCDAVLREHIWFWQENPPPISSITSLVSKYCICNSGVCDKLSAIFEFVKFDFILFNTLFFNETILS